MSLQVALWKVFFSIVDPVSYDLDSFDIASTFLMTMVWILQAVFLSIFLSLRDILDSGHAEILESAFCVFLQTLGI